MARPHCTGICLMTIMTINLFFWYLKKCCRYISLTNASIVSANKVWQFSHLDLMWFNHARGIWILVEFPGNYFWLWILYRSPHILQYWTDCFFFLIFDWSPFLLQIFYLELGKLKKYLMALGMHKWMTLPIIAWVSITGGVKCTFIDHRVVKTRNWLSEVLVFFPRDMGASLF